MGKESKITMMLLALIFMGIIIFQVDQQRRMLKNIIETHERKMDSILNEYKDLNIHYDSVLNNYDSVIHIIDSLPLQYFAKLFISLTPSITLSFFPLVRILSNPSSIKSSAAL